LENTFMEEPLDSPSPLDAPLSEGWSELAPVLPPVGILAGMNDQSLENLAPYGRYHHFNKGDEVIREGQPQESFYIVVMGRLSITALVDGREISLNETEAGECLGEIGLLAPGPASATARALEKTTVWSMNIADFRTYLTEHAGGAGILLLGMTSCLCRRMRHANRLISANRMKPVEILPAGRERAITADNTPVKLGFFDQLKKSFGGR
jgi:CRP-like cAMP-binding protein